MKEMKSEYAQDIRNIVVDEEVIAKFMKEYDGEDIWIGIRTTVEGGCDEEIYITEMPVDEIVKKTESRLDEWAAEVEAAYGDEVVMEDLCIDPETGAGYIAVVISWDHDEEVIDSNLWPGARRGWWEFVR